MIAIINHNTGNFGSILNMFKKIGAEAMITSDESDIKNADRLVLPGVGSFDTGMESLKRTGLIPALEKAVLVDKKPILGICLGMHLFTRKSEEGKRLGLGWIDAETIRLRFDKESGLRVPHMGWNTLSIRQKHPLFNDWLPESRFYFVHSFHVKCASSEDVLAVTSYGIDFHSIIRHENIIGTQFHPEKSHKYGMLLLKNFIKLQS